MSKTSGTVTTLPLRPRGPTMTIGGRKYVLSDMSHLGDMVDDGDFEGARLIDLGGPDNKFRFLWVLDTERHQLAMWQAFEGNAKVAGPSRSFGREIVKLERLGQLNKVSNAEFRAIEREMQEVADRTLQYLKDWISENESDFQRQVNRLAREYFDNHVQPKIDEALDAVDRGVRPLGFKVNEHLVEYGKDWQQQARMYVTDQIFSRFLTEDAVNAYVAKNGLDPEAGDIQAAYWAINDLRDEIYQVLEAQRRVAARYLQRL